jgi:hypothetical protein
MEQKPGYKTTEFWMATISSIGVAVLGLLVGYGTLSSEQADLWQPVIIGFSGVSIALINMGYANSRAKVKSQSQ